MDLGSIMVVFLLEVGVIVALSPEVVIVVAVVVVVIDSWEYMIWQSLLYKLIYPHYKLILSLQKRIRNAN